MWVVEIEITLFFVSARHLGLLDSVEASGASKRKKKKRQSYLEIEEKGRKYKKK